MAIVILTDEVLEKSTGLYEFDLLKEDETPFSLSEIEALTITYYDLDTETIINSRDDQDCLNTNDVELDAAGHLIWEIRTEDSVLLDSRKELEQHIVLFTWTWDTGLRKGRHEVQFPVRNLTLVS